MPGVSRVEKKVLAKRSATLCRAWLCLSGFAVIGLVASLKVSAQAKRESLGEVLASSGVKADLQEVADFDHPIASYAGLSDRGAYLIAYDEAKLEYREMLLSDVEKRFGKRPLRDLLQPPALLKIFDPSTPASTWYQFFQGRLAKVEVARTLYERGKNEDCFIALRVTNLTNRPVGVDLRKFWNVIYPNSWGFSRTPTPELVDEKRMIREPISEEDKKKLMVDYSDHRLKTVMPHTSLTYFRGFTFGRNIRKEIESAGKEYLIVGLDGALEMTDGQTTEEIIFPANDARAESTRWVAIQLPAIWETVPQDSLVVEEHR